jgi:predicted negative regulator of RcsB-dependent stress response
MIDVTGPLFFTFEGYVGDSDYSCWVNRFGDTIQESTRTGYASLVMTGQALKLLEFKNFDKAVIHLEKTKYVIKDEDDE